MSDLKKVLAKLDDYMARWMKEAMDSFWKDGDGLIEPEDPWKEFEEETWQLLREANHQR